MYNHKNNITLRKLEEADLSELLEAKSVSWTTQHKTVFLNMKDQNDWFANIGSDVHMIAETNLEDPVGLVSVTNIDRFNGTASVGMMAYPTHRGSDLTKLLPEVVTDFAFEVLNLRRLEAEVLDNNPAAMIYDLAIGYNIEGRRRRAVYKCGTYHDSILIAILRDEWAASDRVKSWGGICNRDYKPRGPIERAIERGMRMRS